MDISAMKTTGETVSYEQDSYEVTYYRYRDLQ